MKIIKAILLLIIPLLLLASCELFYSPISPTIRMVSVASDYKGVLPPRQQLEVCPKDQAAIREQFEHLSIESGYEYEGIHITYEDLALYSAISSSKNGKMDFERYTRKSSCNINANFMGIRYYIRNNR